MYTIVSSKTYRFLIKKTRKMPIPPLAMTAINTAANAGMGLLLGNINDKRQLEQQQKLTQMQLEAQKQGSKYMADLSYKNQLNMWNATNYEAQVEHMKKAGINPALMYGAAGAGGQLGAGAGGMGISSGQAQQNPGEIQTMIGMGLQARMQEAQIKLAEATARKTDVEADKIGGTDTEESKARIENLLQGVDNARQQHEIQKLEITLKNIENYEKQASQIDRLDYIEYQTRQAMKQLQIVENEAYISSATMEDKIKIVARTAIGAALQNVLTKEQTGKVKSDIRVNEQQINNFVQQNMREWDKMSQQNREIAIKQMLGEYYTDPVNTMSIDKIISNIFKTVK